VGDNIQGDAGGNDSIVRDDNIGRCEKTFRRNICLILNGYRESEVELFGWKHTNIFTKFCSKILHTLTHTHTHTHTHVLLQALPLSLCHKSNDQLVHMISSTDVARRLMLIAKRDKWQFVVKT